MNPTDRDQPGLTAPINNEVGIVLIAHGSRRREANEELLGVAERLRQRGHSMVVPAYLELCEPDIVSGGELAVAQGASTVVLSPYFLSAGRHVVTDLEEARMELARRHPQLRFLIAKPLGPHSALEDILEERLDAVLASTASPAEPAVARGT